MKKEQNYYEILRYATQIKLIEYFLVRSSFLDTVPLIGSGHVQ